MTSTPKRSFLIQDILFFMQANFIPMEGTTGGGTGGRDLDRIEYEVNEDDECCRTATLADISQLFKGV